VLEKELWIYLENQRINAQVNTKNSNKYQENVKFCGYKDGEEMCKLTL
jgi:hypothetical protein